jgi:hypothetical protein
MDLATNGVVITDAIKYVQGKLNYLNGQEKVLLKGIKQQKTTEEKGERERGEGDNNGTEDSELRQQEQEQEQGLKTYNGIF